MAEPGNDHTPETDDGVSLATAVIHHINLKTTRKDQMIEWYTEVLGMRVNFDSPGGAFMSNDAANHRIALLTLPGIEPDSDRRHHDGLHHSAFELPTLDDLNALFLRLRSHGIEPAICVDHRLTLSYYYEDPDGNLVEIQIDGFGDWAKSTDYMRKELMLVTDGPLGIVVDPAKIAEDAAAGLSLAEILKRSEDGLHNPPPDFVPDMKLPPLPAGFPPLFKTFEKSE